MDTTKNTLKNDKLPILWKFVILNSLFHIIGSYGIFLLFKGYPKFYTIIFATILGILSNFGALGGAHRLWSHRSYKANAPLRLLLAFFQASVYEYSVIRWARDHRIHHKYTDTNSDPYNVTRGIFYSHIGWLMVKRHPDAIEKGRKVDLSDLYSDPILRFQHKYYFILMPIIAFILPVIIPIYFWQETFVNAFCVNMLRFLMVVHSTFAINSVAHRYGYKPFDRHIQPTDRRSISLLTLGEGYHNYHHAFPWDYKSTEYGTFAFNLTRGFIEFFAMIGWAYDLKTASEEIIRARVKRTGDGSHPIWGWGDKDQNKEDFKTAIIVNKEKTI